MVPIETRQTELMSLIAISPGEWFLLKYSEAYGVYGASAEKIIAGLVEMHFVRREFARISPGVNGTRIKLFYPSDYFTQVSTDLSGLILPSPFDSFKAEAVEAKQQMDRLPDRTRSWYDARAVYIGKTAVLGEEVDLRQQTDDWFSGQAGWQLLVDVQAATDLISSSSE